MRCYPLSVLGVVLVAAACGAAPVAAQNLTLVINPRTGATSIQNVGGSPVNIDGYLIGSPAGALQVGGWNSLQSAGQTGWRTANPASTHLSELNLFGSSSLGPTASLSLGAAYTPFVPTAIGQVEPAVTFDYHVAGGTTIQGTVLFTPATGAASIQNQSNFSVNIDGYLISSPAGALSPSGWTSFVDSGQTGWREANPAPTHLSELNLFGSRSFPANGAPVPIGAPVNIGALNSLSDLQFDYHIAGGATVRGSVAFALPSSASQDGDFDGNGRVDGADFLTWQRGLGSAYNAADLTAWRNNYGAGGAAAAVGAAAHAVPEPAAASMAIAVAAALATTRRRR
ncbi:MAG TPA: hypothetical protein PJ982_19390 [Lacipirellulaceae bacterium]|nr:hypothetical protein [Lacipirellulaceae bacterium]